MRGKRRGATRSHQTRANADNINARGAGLQQACSGGTQRRTGGDDVVK